MARVKAGNIEDRIFECPQCAKWGRKARFSSPAGVTLHIRRKHAKDKARDYSMTRKGTMGERTFVCQSCTENNRGRSKTQFASRGGLSKHMALAHRKRGESEPAPQITS